MGIFSENLKFLRKHKNYSQTELADLLGISRNKIASYESRNIEPKLSVLISISDCFEILVEDLLKTDINTHNILEKTTNYTLKNKNFKQKGKDFTPGISAKNQAAFVSGHLKTKKIYSGIKAYIDAVGESIPPSSFQLKSIIEFAIEYNDEIID